MNPLATPLPSLAGRVVAVTGASRGIGLAIVELLVQHGAQVVAGARHVTQGALPGARFVALDVSSPGSVREFSELAIAAGVDALVNNAGVGSFAPIEDITVDDYRRVMDTNVLGLLLATQGLIPQFKRRHAAGQGSQVINITSDVSARSFAGGGLYTASKHAQRALTQALAHEGAAYSLRVTEIRPGMTDTHFNGSSPGSPERALHLRPRDIAEAVLYTLGAPPTVRLDEIVLHPVVQPVVF